MLDAVEVKFVLATVEWCVVVGNVTVLITALDESADVPLGFKVVFR